jgi:hypothetical protein
VIRTGSDADRKIGLATRSFAADAHDCIMVRTSTNPPNTGLRRKIRLSRELPSDLIVPPRAQASRRCQTQAPLDRLDRRPSGRRSELNTREAFSPPSPFFSRKRRRRDRSVDVIALSPIGVRVIGDEPFISLHEFTHDPKGAFDIDFWAFDTDF